MRRVSRHGRRFLALLRRRGGGLLYWFLSNDGIRIALEQQATAWLGQPVTIASARAALAAARHGAAAGRRRRAGAPALAEVDVSAPALGPAGRRIADAAIRIRNTRLELPLVPFRWPRPSRRDGATDRRRRHRHREPPPAERRFPHRVDQLDRARQRRDRPAAAASWRVSADSSFDGPA